MTTAQNIQRIQQQLPPGASLVAVSKTRSTADILAAYRAGQRDFGESRPQELAQKAAALPPDIRWHFIGHLQTNKVKMVVPHAHLIHSIDSEKLLHAVSTFCQKTGTTARCLLQVHVAQEDTKHGFRPEALLSLLQSNRLQTLTGVTLEGLMGMATRTDNMEQVRREFRQLKALHRQAAQLLPHPAPFTQLSMGMSHDYPTALREGATLIRVGSAIFQDSPA